MRRYRFGDSVIELADANEKVPPRPAALHVYVDDVDAVYAKALEKGAKSINEPTDQEYGERGASIVDEFGNHWYVATPLKGEKIPEGLRAVTPYLALENTGRFIQFIKEAFGAQEKLVVPARRGRCRARENRDWRFDSGNERCAWTLQTDAVRTPFVCAGYGRGLRAGAARGREIANAAGRPAVRRSKRWGDRSIRESVVYCDAHQGRGFLARVEPRNGGASSAATAATAWAQNGRRLLRQWGRWPAPDRAASFSERPRPFHALRRDARLRRIV